MSDNPDEKLRSFVNSSGFPLQIGIKQAVEDAWREQKWGVMTEEHPWKNPISGENGFIDLLLHHQSKTQILVAECKRVRDSQWIFFVPSDKRRKYSRAKSWTTFLEAKWFGWLDRDLRPTSFESSFCVVPGQDAKAKPMLERIASSLIEATEAFAMEERSLGVFRPDHLRAYFSIIVTTADLKICRFNPAEIELKSGEITNCEFEDVPSIRFRKSLTARNEKASSKNITDVFREKERTVFVVNSLFFLDFLKDWEIGDLPSVLRQ